MTTWITRFDVPTDGRLRVAVKDAIDVAGTVTTAGCAAVRDRAAPAVVDAACLAGVRDADAAIVGKTTLTELCVSPVGDNDVFGTPVNPVAPDRIPGGSSSGSAVAVATGEADLGLGTDTGGSVRIPAACCGVAALKTTHGLVPTEGVVPLAPTLDTVGPIARDVAGVAAGMRLLAPKWTVAPRAARTVGRLRVDGVEPAVEAVVDEALDRVGLPVRDVTLPGWDASHHTFVAIVLGELWQEHHDLLDAEGVGAFVNSGIRAGRGIDAETLADARAAALAWRAELTALFREVDVLALPTLVAEPPPPADVADYPLTRLTAPANLAGVPALSMPVPSPGFVVPVSLQLIGPMHGEGLLCATGLAVESAVGDAG
jgi:amidase